MSMLLILIGTREKLPLTMVTERTPSFKLSWSRTYSLLYFLLWNLDTRLCHNMIKFKVSLRCIAPYGQRGGTILYFHSYRKENVIHVSLLINEYIYCTTCDNYIWFNITSFYAKHFRSSWSHIAQKLMPERLAMQGETGCAAKVSISHYMIGGHCIMSCKIVFKC